MNDYDYEDNAPTGGFLDSLLGTAGRVVDIYRNVTQPAKAAQTPANRPQVQTPLGNFSPWAIGGAVLALFVGLWLALRRP